jgi:hypothetical protein
MLVDGWSAVHLYDCFWRRRTVPESEMRTLGVVVFAPLLDLAAIQITPDQIAEAQRMAGEWLAKHQR